MADTTIRQRITLDGADDVIKRLQDMGTKGEGALKALKDAADKQPLANVSASLDKIKESTPGFVNGINSAVGSMSSLGGAFSLLVGRAGPIGIALGALGGTILGIAKGANDAIVSTKRMAESLGLTTKEYQTLRSAAGRVGIDPEVLTRGLATFEEKARAAAEKQKGTLVDIGKEVSKGLPGQGIKLIDAKALQEARAAIGPLAETIFNMLKQAGATGVSLPAVRQSIEERAEKDEGFRTRLREGGARLPSQTTPEALQQKFAPGGDEFAKLGLSALDASGKIKSLEQRLREWVDAVSAIKDPTEQTSRIFEVFGRRLGPQLAPLVRQGTAAWDEIAKMLQDKGLLITKEMEEVAEKNERAMKRLTTAWEGLSKRAGRAAIPALTGGLEAAQTLFDTPKERAERPAGGTEELRARFGEPPQWLKLLTGEGGQKIDLGQIFQTVLQNSRGVGTPFATTPQSPNEAGSRPATPEPDEFKKSISDATTQTTSFKNSLSALGDLIKAIAGNIKLPASAGTFADGGLVRGPGSGTSDSILASLASGGHIRVSNGEYVVNARATAQHLPLLHSINSGAIARFAAGGFIGLDSIPIPRFAAGGVASGGGLHPVTINFNGSSIGGMFAGADTVKQLSQASIQTQAARTGPRPSWYRG